MITIYIVECYQDHIQHWTEIINLNSERLEIQQHENIFKSMDNYLYL